MVAVRGNQEDDDVATWKVLPRVVTQQPPPWQPRLPTPRQHTHAFIMTDDKSCSPPCLGTPPRLAIPVEGPQDLGMAALSPLALGLGGGVEGVGEACFRRGGEWLQPHLPHLASPFFEPRLANLLVASRLARGASRALGAAQLLFCWEATCATGTRSSAEADIGRSPSERRAPNVLEAAHGESDARRTDVI